MNCKMARGAAAILFPLPLSCSPFPPPPRPAPICLLSIHTCMAGPCDSLREGAEPRAPHPPWRERCIRTERPRPGGKTRKSNQVAERVEMGIDRTLGTGR